MPVKRQMPIGDNFVLVVFKEADRERVPENRNAICALLLCAELSIVFGLFKLLNEYFDQKPTFKYLGRTGLTLSPQFISKPRQAENAYQGFPICVYLCFPLNSQQQLQLEDFFFLDIKFILGQNAFIYKLFQFAERFNFFIIGNQCISRFLLRFFYFHFAQ